MTRTCSRMRGSFSYGPYNACAAPPGLISLMVQPCQTRRHATDQASSFLDQGRADMTAQGNETGCTCLANDQVFVNSASIALEAPKRSNPRATFDIKLDNAHDGISHATAVRGRGWSAGPTDDPTSYQTICGAIPRGQISSDPG